MTQSIRRQFQRVAIGVLKALILSFTISHVCLAQDGAVKTWGAVLNPDGQVPLGSFKAFYFNTNDPRQVVASENVADVAINYSWDAFHSIKSEDFGAYWVGWLNFHKDEARVIEVSQSWSKTRIIIDGKVVYEGGSNARQPFTFTRGQHLVEVEYINNWHTTSVRVNFGSASAPRSQAQVLEQLQGPEFRGAEVHFIGLYESSAKDMSVRVQVAPSTKPLILVFSSYDAIKWVINESKPGTVRAAIFGSFNPGSEVRGLDPRRSHAIALAGTVGTYDLKRRCTCVAGTFHCESSGDLLSTASAVEKLTGFPLATFSGAYSNDQAAIPGLAVTPEVKEQARVTADKERVQGEKCMRDADPDFNKLFDEPSGG